MGGQREELIDVSSKILDIEALQNMSGNAKEEEISNLKDNVESLTKERSDIVVPYPDVGLYDTGSDYDEIADLQYKKRSNKYYWDEIDEIDRYLDTESLYSGHLSRTNGGEYYFVNRYLSDDAELTYQTTYEKLVALKKEIKSDEVGASLDKDKTSGVFVKYAIDSGSYRADSVMACDLLDFVSDNMNDNSLLKERMTDENRQKVFDAQKDVEKANDLFCGENYSRMLLSVNLPNESAETTEFVDYLAKEVKNVFGDEACITGEIVSTYDLEKSFDHDNLFITVFTLISIFVIVMLVFRSLSLPVILVAIIQGAIFIAMSTQLLGSGIFFMSYIVSTCILMGATIDYGILMSSNYVAYRGEHDKKEALELSVRAAMPTVFTSGLILTVCGFVIYFISGQNSISTVGLLIGVGTICSVIMITFVLPSVLYLTDRFVLKLSLRKKK